ncbi:phage integrase central domain-containing protein [Sulfitobacter aestuariivivens]
MRWHIDNLAKPIHNRPIDQINAAELLHLLKPIERSGRRETAKKLRATISAVFPLAMVTMRAPGPATDLRALFCESLERAAPF